MTPGKRRVWWEHLLARFHNELYMFGIRFGNPHVAGWGNTPRPVRWVGSGIGDLLKARGYW